MHENVHGHAKRVLVVGTVPADAHISPDSLVAADGMLIVMEQDAARAAQMRSRFASGESMKRTVIGGDPRRMLYKLAGPFDVIFCSQEYLSLRPRLEKLLAADGVLIAGGEP